MRSLWYLLTGRPVNTDDCLHYAAGKAGTSVAITLRVCKTLRVAVLVTQYVARMTWNIDGRTIVCEELLAGELDCTGDDKPEILEDANAHLGQLVKRCEREGVAIAGGRERFTLPISCEVVRTPRWI